MVKVKICGINNWEDAVASVIAGADALGFVFYKKSPRYISPKKVKHIIKILPKDITKIGVFVNAKEKMIRKIAKVCRLNFLQFHGDESPQFCQRFKGYRIIKAFRIRNRLDLTKIKRYKTYAWLFDTFSKSKFGGTGKNFNWKLLAKIDKIKHPVFLSGGLNARNVKEAIKIVKPDWVDVSSSVEIKPGKKDNKKIRGLIEAAKE